ncbi:MmpS family transport accessory protein [Pseudonocardia sp.]|uniref:MmpS family transport accessory protein n=1 Tax=Pseudonocardia sp. TaxID=60912 RepID=UPI0031FD4C29
MTAPGPSPDQQPQWRPPQPPPGAPYDWQPPNYPPSAYGQFGPPPPGYGQLPRRRRHGLWWKIPLLVLLALIVIGEIGALSNRGSSSTTASPANAGGPSSSGSGSTVTYVVTGGQATAGNVTFGTEGFQTAQISGVALPWTHDVPWSEKPGQFSGLSLLAQNGPENSTLTCQILVDGQQVATNTSSGPYAIVTCMGS